MEEVIVGTLLASGEGFEFVDVEPQDFSPPYNIIMEVIARLWEKNRPYDLVAVQEQLNQEGKLQLIGGTQRLTLISMNATTPSLLPHYVSLFKERLVRRQLADALAKAHEILSMGGDIKEALAKIEEASLCLRQDELEAIDIEKAFVEFQQLKNKKSEVKLPWPSVAQLIPALEKGEYMIVGGRPGSGKTAFLLTLVKYLCVMKRIPSLYVSLETPPAVIVQRLLSSLSQTSLRQVKEKGVDPEYENTLKKAPLVLVTRTDATPSSIAKIIRRHVYGIRPVLVFVDYIQLLKSGSHSSSRYEEVTKVSRQLKLLAMQEEVILIAAAQLSRTADREKKDPDLADLRDSSALESDSDYVLILYPEKKEEEEEENIRLSPGGPKKMVVKIAKNRNGPVGNVILDFQAHISSYEEDLERAKELEAVPF